MGKEREEGREREREREREIERVREREKTMVSRYIFSNVTLYPHSEQVLLQVSLSGL